MAVSSEDEDANKVPEDTNDICYLVDKIDRSSDPDADLMELRA
jgi:hypothetical protein